MAISTKKTPYELITGCYYMDESNKPLTWGKACRIARFINKTYDLFYAHTVTPEEVVDVWSDLDSQAIYESILMQEVI